MLGKYSTCCTIFPVSILGKGQPGSLQLSLQTHAAAAQGRVSSHLQTVPSGSGMHMDLCLSVCLSLSYWVVVGAGRGAGLPAILSKHATTELHPSTALPSFGDKTDMTFIIMGWEHGSVAEN